MTDHVIYKMNKQNKEQIGGEEGNYTFEVFPLLKTDKTMTI